MTSDYKIGATNVELYKFRHCEAEPNLLAKEMSSNFISINSKSFQNFGLDIVLFFISHVVQHLSHTINDTVKNLISCYISPPAENKVSAKSEKMNE